MDIVVFFEAFIGFILKSLLWSVIIVLGLIIITRPKLLFLIPYYICKGIGLVLVLLFLKILDAFISFGEKIEVDNFEKYINNEGIKNDLDVSACHSFFNKVSNEKIRLLFNIYSNKVKEEIDKEEYCDEAQVKRYINLLEIMNRCMVFKQEKSPF